MKLKTFTATYLLFLFILFASIGAISVYITNIQMKMLMEKSMAEYQTISSSFLKDLTVLQSRNGDFASGANYLAAGYASYYRKYGIVIGLTGLTAGANEKAQASFESREGEYRIYITGSLPVPFESYRFNYHYNITKNVNDLKTIQKTLLGICIAVSVIMAFALYFIVARLFKPLGIIAGASRQIAGGRYDVRIDIKGKNELSDMAKDYNKMADEIERHIRLLEDEAENKQRFIDNFAHEMRTPLTLIYGYAEYIQKTPLGEQETIDSAQFIIDAAAHMKRLSVTLLELATLRNHTPVRDNIPLAMLFEDIAKMMKPPLREKNIEFICGCGADTLQAQESLIKSLLINLCQNAIQACGPDGGVIKLACERQGGNIIISVTDNGRGIASADIPRITEPFYRADKARSREEGGVGIGLTLCRQIVQLHGGDMTIESKIGEGTAVKITFTNP